MVNGCMASWGLLEGSLGGLGLGLAKVAIVQWVRGQGVTLVMMNDMEPRAMALIGLG